MGRICEHPVIQRHLGSCHIESSATGIDAYSVALTNCSKVALYHDAYEDLSSLFSAKNIATGRLSGILRYAGKRRDYIEATRLLVDEYGEAVMKARTATRRLSFDLDRGAKRLPMTVTDLDEEYLQAVIGKTSYVRGFFGLSNTAAQKEVDYTMHALLKRINQSSGVFEEMQGRADRAQDRLDRMGSLLPPLLKSAQYALNIIQSDKEHRTRNEYIHAHVPCEWRNLCGLLWKPEPFSPEIYGALLSGLKEIQRHCLEAHEDIWAMMVATESNRMILRDTKQALDRVLIAANKTDKPFWLGNENAIVMEIRRGRLQLRESAHELLAMEASFPDRYRDSRPLDRPVPKFQFPTLDRCDNPKPPIVIIRTKQENLIVDHRHLSIFQSEY
ncbi:hypothetical protein PG993_005736 [Apiospora rasikravindrae]|uniref:Uncharacterized protein n=1 Tax=Apiospora rasikravindrae TaxID=990691 RepID=A0ABR1T9N0_9PEZI